MKRIISLLLVGIVFLTFLTGCGSKKREMLYSSSTIKNVKLAEYEGLKLATNSTYFQQVYDSTIETDIVENSLYVRKTSGYVMEGDLVNIDFEGKVKGKTFEGSSAKDYTLKVGMGTFFVEGFEDELKGAKIGETLNVELVMPRDYMSAPELSHKVVKFKIKINFVSTNEKMTPEQYYKILGYDTLEEYKNSINEKAAKTYLLREVLRNSRIKKYNDKDIEREYNVLKKSIPLRFGVDFNTYLETEGETEASFKAKIIESNIKSTIKKQMVIYSIFNKEKLSITDNDIEKITEKALKSYNDSTVTAEELKKIYGDKYFEYLAVTEKVTNFIYSKAKIS